MSEAQGAIDAARAVGAEQYASAEYQAATTALKESHDAVQQRDYRLALSRAIDASQRAQDAAKRAAEGMARARSDAETSINAAAKTLEQLAVRLQAADAARVPARDSAAARKAAATAEAALQEARAALRTGDYTTAGTRATDIARTISEQITDVDDAIAARAGRPGRRRR